MSADHEHAQLVNSDVNWNTTRCVIYCHFAPPTNETRPSLNDVCVAACLTCQDENKTQNVDGFTPEFCILDLRCWLIKKTTLFTPLQDSPLFGQQKTVDKRNVPCLTRQTSSAGAGWENYEGPFDVLYLLSRNKCTASAPTYVRNSAQVEFYVSQNFLKCLCSTRNYSRWIWLKEKRTNFKRDHN